MRIIVVVAVTCLLLSYCRASAGECLNKNPFISALPRHVVLEYPIRSTSNRCWPIWKKAGTCCKANKLAFLVKRERENMNIAISKINQDFADFRNFFNTFNLSMQHIAALAYFNWTGLVNDTSTAKNLRNLIRDSQNHWLSSPRLYGWKYPNVVEMFANATKKCWKKMVNLKIASLCSTCAGDSEKYFFKEKANIADSACSVLIEDCWQSFKLLNSYVFRLLSSTPLFRLEQNFGSEIIKVVAPTSLDVRMLRNLVNSYFQTSDIAPVLELYNPTKIEQNATLAKLQGMMSRTLCRNFIKLKGVSVLWVINLIVEGKPKVELGPVAVDLIKSHKKALGEQAYNALIESQVQKFVERGNKNRYNSQKQWLKYLEENDAELNSLIEEAAKKKKSKRSRILNFRFGSRAWDEENEPINQDSFTGPSQNQGEIMSDEQKSVNPYSSEDYSYSEQYLPQDDDTPNTEDETNPVYESEIEADQNTSFQIKDESSYGDKGQTTYYSKRDFYTEESSKAPTTNTSNASEATVTEDTEAGATEDSRPEAVSDGQTKANPEANARDYETNAADKNFEEKLVGDETEDNIVGHVDEVNILTGSAGSVFSGSNQKSHLLHKTWESVVIGNYGLVPMNLSLVFF